MSPSSIRVKSGSIRTALRVPAVLLGAFRKRRINFPSICFVCDSARLACIEMRPYQRVKGQKTWGTWTDDGNDRVFIICWSSHTSPESELPLFFFKYRVVPLLSAEKQWVVEAHFYDKDHISSFHHFHFGISAALREVLNFLAEYDRWKWCSSIEDTTTNFQYHSQVSNPIITE